MLPVHNPVLKLCAPCLCAVGTKAGMNFVVRSLINIVSCYARFIPLDRPSFRCWLAGTNLQSVKILHDDMVDKISFCF